MAETDSVQGHFSEGSLLWLSYNSNFTLSSSICLAALISMAPEKNLCFLSNEILKQTNLYGQQYLQSHVDYLHEHPRARAHDFSKRTFTLGELYNFLSLVITMGIVSLPSIPSYWRTSWPFLNDGFRKVMSRDRFLLLLKFLHLSDNEKYISFGQAGHDRLYKIRPIITHLIAQFKSSYKPNQNCSIDESIISYKGRLSFLQYLPKKPHKWGIKAWVLADAKSGYTWNLDIYTGRSDERDSNLPLSSHVVLSLAADLLGKGYNFFFDNFYTSPDLCKRLYQNNSGSCGTVRLNRKGIPDWFKRKHVEKGEVITYRDGCIVFKRMCILLYLFNSIYFMNFVNLISILKIISSHSIIASHTNV